MDHSMTAGFAPGPGTPVWSPSLTPLSESEYIGALLGLFLLSVAFRGLVAAQGYFEAYLHLHLYPRPPSRSHPKQPPFTSFPPSRTNEQQQPEPSSPAPLLGPAHSTELDADHQQHRNVEPESTVLEFIDEKHILPSDNTVPPRSSAHHQGSLLQVPPAGQGAQQRRRYAVMSNRRPLPPHQDDSPAYHQQPSIHHHHDNNDFSVEPPTSWLFPLPTAQPFVWQAEISRALLATLVIAVGYMLMLVIMTYNSAYLAVILAGVFVGEVYFARWGRVRPIFPAPLRRGRPEGVDSHPQNPTPQHLQQQQQAQSDVSTIPSELCSNTHDSINWQQQQGEPLTRTSATSVRSSTSSRGYSSTMMNHGLSADGAC